MKRCIDIVISFFGLILLSPLLGLVALLIKLNSSGPVIFKQERIGRNFRPFLIYKFRTMVRDAPQKGGLLTAEADPRITSIGRILRKTKIDELPQLINVFKGDMSLVGPRPEVQKYVDMFRQDYEELLKIRPGITDPASLQFSDEGSLLALGDSLNMEEEYSNQILPKKIFLSKEYLKKSSPTYDFILILKTLLHLSI